MVKTVRKTAVGKAAAAAMSRAALKAPAKGRPASPVVAAKAAADPVQAKSPKEKTAVPPPVGNKASSMAVRMREKFTGKARAGAMLGKVAPQAGAGPVGPGTSPAAGVEGTSAPWRPKPRPLPDGPAEVLGQIAWLMMSSPLHKHLFIADLEWLAAPPLMLKQFRIFRHNKVPIGYASWAFVSEAAEQRLMSGACRLQPAEWNAGDRIWLMDLVAAIMAMSPEFYAPELPRNSAGRE